MGQKIVRSPDYITEANIWGESCREIKLNAIRNKKVSFLSEYSEAEVSSGQDSFLGFAEHILGR